MRAALTGEDQAAFDRLIDGRNIEQVLSRLRRIAGLVIGTEDDHLNEMMFDAAKLRERSEFAVFSYADISDGLSKRAEHTPNLQVIGRNEAILGGVRRSWKKPESDVPGVWEDGMLTLPDFTYLASYLARSGALDGEVYDNA